MVQGDRRAVLLCPISTTSSICTYVHLLARPRRVKAAPSRVASPASGRSSAEFRRRLRKPWHPSSISSTPNFYLTGQPIDSALRHLFSLPCHEGGLGVLDPTTLGTQYCSSRSVTSSLVENIVAQCPQLGDALATVSHIKTRVRNEARPPYSGGCCVVHHRSS